jgi:hypothetical protein
MLERKKESENKEKIHKNINKDRKYMEKSV